MTASDETLECSNCGQPALGVLSPHVDQPLCAQCFEWLYRPGGGSMPDLKDRIELDCGRTVVLDAVNINRTYWGVLEGYHTEENNQRMIERWVETVRRNWGDGKVPVIPPRLNEADPDHPELPPVCFAACLSCYETIDEERDCTTLSVVWFGDDFGTRPLQELVHEAVRGLPWDELADDLHW